MYNEYKRRGLDLYGIRKILIKLGWKTKINFKKGLEKTFLWYLRNDRYYKSISKKDIVKRIGKI